MKPNLCTVGILLCLAHFALAQPPQIEWEATYGGNNEEECKALVQTEDGGFALAGCTFSFGASGGDFYLVRTDANGDTLWTRTYGGSGYDHAESIVEMPDGGFVLVGCVDSTYGYAVRTNSGGNALWARTYTFALMPYWGGFASVVRTTDNFLSVAGMTFDLVDSTGSFLLVKIDPADGDTIWTRTYGAGGALWSVCMNHIQTSDEGYALAGTIGYFDPVPPLVVEDAYFKKTDNAGNPQWATTLSELGNQEFHSVKEIPGGGFSLAGDNQLSNYYHFWLVILDEAGTQVENRIYGGPNSNCRDHIRTADGGYLLAGRIWTETSRDPLDGYDCWALKTDANGDSLWAIYGGGPAEDRWCSVLQTADYRYALAGNRESEGSEWKDMYLMLTEPDPVGMIETRPLASPGSFAVYPASPNPFNPTTAISFELRAASYVKLEVFDINGRDVGAKRCFAPEGGRPSGSPLQSWYPAGSHHLTFDGAGLPSGIYLARLTAGELCQTQKLVLLK